MTAFAPAIAIGGAALAATAVAASVILTEASLRIRAGSRKSPDDAQAAAIAAPLGARFEPVEIGAEDGIVLRAWLFYPAAPATDAVIVQHGFGDTRHGVLRLVEALLRNGFAVLTPDSRGHGSSGDAVVTFGIRESGDLRRWSGWLRERRGAARVHALGESMGAASILQSLADRPPFDNVAAECSFSAFPDIAVHRLATRYHLRLPWSKPLLWTLTETGFQYARRVYGVDLRRASPVEAIRETSVPVLLIHGAEDRTVPPVHSRRLHEANRRATQLWEVPDAAHVAASTAAPEEFERRVAGWFRASR